MASRSGGTRCSGDSFIAHGPTQAPEAFGEIAPPAGRRRRYSLRGGALRLQPQPPLARRFDRQSSAAAISVLACGGLSGSDSGQQGRSRAACAGTVLVLIAAALGANAIRTRLPASAAGRCTLRAPWRGRRESRASWAGAPTAQVWLSRRYVVRPPVQGFDRQLLVIVRTAQPGYAQRLVESPARAAAARADRNAPTSWAGAMSLVRRLERHRAIIGSRRPSRPAAVAVARGVACSISCPDA